MSKRRSTRAFKLKVVQVVGSGELRPTQACRAYQIGARVMNRWRQEVRLRGTNAAFTPLETLRAVPDYAARIAELEQFCGQVAVAHAALQKAVQRLPSPHSTSVCEPATGISEPVDPRAVPAPQREPRVVLRTRTGTAPGRVRCGAARCHRTHGTEVPG